MYYQLGTIKFEALIGFESFNKSQEVVYAQHDLINRKARLERTATGLINITGSIQFHKEFCTPEYEIAALQVAMLNSEILTLVMGNGRIVGDFVIVSMNENILDIASNGNYILVKVDVVLKECYNEDKEGQQLEAAQADAKALKENNPAVVRGQPLAYQTPNGQLTTSMVMCGAECGEINSAVTEASMFNDMFGYNSEKIQKAVDSLNNKLGAMDSILQGNPNLSAICPGLPGSIADLFNAGASIIALMPMNIGTIAGVLNANTSLQGVMDIMKVNAAPAVAKSMTRRL